MYFQFLKARKSICLGSVITAVFLSLTGCAMNAGPQSHPAINSRVVAKNLIIQDWNAFRVFSKEAFAERVSLDFRPDQTIFLNQLQDYYQEYLPVELSVTVNKALHNKDKLVISFKWQKRSISRSTGKPVLKEGKAEIVYIYLNQIWKIYKISGDSVFTF